jgi:predicted amidohydrolase
MVLLPGEERCDIQPTKYAYVFGLNSDNGLGLNRITDEFILTIPQDQTGDNYKYAYAVSEHPAIAKMAVLAKELGVVLPVSFFERANNAHFNSLVVIDADGALIGDTYRKSHIPDGPGYQEKWYFSPGDSGFKVWDTKYGKIGCAICWDQCEAYIYVFFFYSFSGSLSLFASRLPSCYLAKPNISHPL